MFLHIGGDNYILKDDIVAIIDKESIQNSKETNELVRR